MQQPVLMARQPIFDSEVGVVAYELLFRQSDLNEANVTDGDSATSELLINAFTHFNIDDVVGNKRAYVNFTRKLLDEPIPFDKRRFVIEVLEDVVIDADLVDCIARLVAEGYTIALDDFIMQPGAEALLELAEIVKIDVLDYTTEELASCVERLSKYKLTLLAEKVETHEMYNLCRSLGFELFQGYFLSRPQMLTGKRIPASKLAVMELLGRLQDPDIGTHDLEDVIARDPVLSIRTLRLVNSAFHRRMSKIESLQRAIAYLGIRQIRSLASLLALTNLSDKPSALKSQTIVRAKMCEELAGCFDEENPSGYFSVGLLSTLDAYFDQPLADVLKAMSLHEDLVGALTTFEGNYGKVLQAVISHEKAQWTDVDWEALAGLNIHVDELNEAYREAITWTDASGLANRPIN